LTGREEAPRSTSIGVILRDTGWLPTTVFGLTNLLVNAHIAAFCFETVGHIALLRRRQENQECQGNKNGLHPYK
jgi:hypothetical protein